MEIFDVYDKNRHLSGRKITRGTSDFLLAGEYHLVVDLILVNSKGQFLIQKRSADKSYCPNMWGLTGGCVSAGENSLQAIMRETKEEIGLNLQEQDLRLFHKAYGEDQPILIDIWVAFKDVDIADFSMQKEDVCELKWVNEAGLKDIFDKKQFMPTLIPFIQKYLMQK